MVWNRLKKFIVYQGCLFHPSITTHEKSYPFITSSWSQKCVPFCIYGIIQWITHHDHHCLDLLPLNWQIRTYPKWYRVNDVWSLTEVILRKLLQLWAHENRLCIIESKDLYLPEVWPWKPLVVWLLWLHVELKNIEEKEDKSGFGTSSLLCALYSSNPHEWGCSLLHHFFCMVITRK